MKKKLNRMMWFVAALIVATILGKLAGREILGPMAVQSYPLKPQASAAQQTAYALPPGVDPDMVPWTPVRIEQADGTVIDLAPARPAPPVGLGPPPLPTPRHYDEAIARARKTAGGRYPATVALSVDGSGFVFRFDVNGNLE